MRLLRKFWHCCQLANIYNCRVCLDILGSRFKPCNCRLGLTKILNCSVFLIWAGSLLSLKCFFYGFSCYSMRNQMCCHVHLLEATVSFLLPQYATFSLIFPCKQLLFTFLLVLCRSIQMMLLGYKWSGTWRCIAVPVIFHFPSCLENNVRIGYGSSGFDRKKVLSRGW